MSFVSHGYLKLPCPAEWSDQTQIVLAGPESGGFRPTIIIAHERVAPSQTAGDLAERARATLLKALPQYQLLSEGPQTLGGRTVFAREYAFNLGGAGRMQAQVYLVRPPVGLVITYTHLPELFALHRADLAEVVAGLELELPEG